MARNTERKWTGRMPTIVGVCGLLMFVFSSVSELQTVRSFRHSSAGIDRFLVVMFAVNMALGLLLMWQSRHGLRSS